MGQSGGAARFTPACSERQGALRMESRGEGRGNGGGRMEESMDGGNNG